jgi:Leucine-rich repeat (LRR) protein
MKLKSFTVKLLAFDTYSPIICNCLFVIPLWFLTALPAIAQLPEASCSVRSKGLENEVSYTFSVERNTQYPKEKGRGARSIISIIRENKVDKRVSSKLASRSVDKNVDSQLRTVPESDSLALVDLYKYTKGLNWTNNTNWLTGPVDAWYGVSVHGGRVTKLSLYDNGLNGNLPSSLGNLSALREMTMYNNQLTGSIPSSIGKLSSLWSLILSGNQLSGNIPDEIGNMSSLSSLWLSNNQLTGSIPSSIGNLSSLWSLLLSDNQLSGNIPAEIGNLRSLGDLALIRNQLSGSIPASLGNLSELQQLLLADNLLTGSIPASFEKLTHLNTLWLHKNQLNGEIPSGLGKLTALEQLVLSNNQLTGNLPFVMDTYDRLQHLDLSYNRLNGSVPAGLFNSPSLRVVDLASNHFNSLPVLTGHYNWIGVSYNRLTFESLELNINKFSSIYQYAPQDSVGTTTDLLLESGQSIQLSALVGGVNNHYQWTRYGADIAGANQPTLNITTSGVYSCRITNTLVAGLILYHRKINVSTANPGGRTVPEADSLALVDLFNSTDGNNWTTNTNWLTGKVNTWFGVTVEVGRVSKLELMHNRLHGSIPASIGNLSDLQVLWLSENQLTGTIPASFEKLKILQRLFLQFNQLSGSIPPNLGDMQSLKQVWLFSNQLSGEIPSELSKSKTLEDLALSNNQLTGSIPASLAKITTLLDLNLSSNQLSGNIPSELGDLTLLNSVILSNNKLTGSVPASLGKLESLYTLWLSDNQLNGSIPDELGNLKNLQTLGLSNNHLVGGIPRSFGKLEKMMYLFLSENQLSGSLPDGLGNMSNLAFLVLWSNQLSGSVPAGLAKLSGLYYLDLSNNQFSTLPVFDVNPSTFSVRNNRLTFESLEPNITKFADLMEYAPQDSVGNTIQLTLTAGQSLELSALVGGANNRYQWTKDGIDIPGANQATLTVTQVGTYGCNITNTVVTGLTLHRRRVHVSIESPADCQASGTILREYWAKVNGNQTADVPVNKAPTSSSYLTSFEGPTKVGENYASRIRGYLCAPETGNYTFWIASDDYGDLYLSSDDNEANKQLIAWIKGWSNPRQWNKHYSQKSALVYLEKGKRYYIEALHKQAWVNDNLAVAWRMPSSAASTSPVVIPGSVLSPFVTANARQEMAELSDAEEKAGLNLQAAPNPFSVQTTITFTARENGRAVLDLYDLQGKKVQGVFDAEVQAGDHRQAEVKGSRLGQGLYLLRLVNGSQVQHIKVLINK